jgi:hypothetical protein
LRKLSFRAVFPILAAVLFALLSVASLRQKHIIDRAGWEKVSDHQIDWGDEPVDIGTPADILLLVFNLPVLIALLPLLPLTCWIDSEIVLRTAWGLGAVGQWFLIGRCSDIHRGHLPVWSPGTHLLLCKTMFGVMVAAGSVAAGLGIFGEASGHQSPWGVARDASFVFWGIIFVILALRWRSSSYWPREHFDSLGLS